MHFTLEGYGGNVRTDFGQFLLRDGMVVLKGLLLLVITLGGCGTL